VVNWTATYKIDLVTIRTFFAALLISKTLGQQLWKLLSTRCKETKPFRRQEQSVSLWHQNHSVQPVSSSRNCNVSRSYLCPLFVSFDIETGCGPSLRIPRKSIHSQMRSSWHQPLTPCIWRTSFLTKAFLLFKMLWRSLIGFWILRATILVESVALFLLDCGSFQLFA